jgi:uncharacterized protein (DUF2236 family)
VSYVVTTTYGATPEVEAMARRVNAVHTLVNGITPAGVSYAADDASLKAWVHCSLTESILAAWDAFGPRRLTKEEADAFVEEQARVAKLLGVNAPTSVADLRLAMASYHAVLGRTEATSEAVDFLRKPRLAIPVRAPYAIVSEGARAILTQPYSAVLGVGQGVHRRRMAVFAGRLFCSAWRVALPSNAVVATAHARVAAGRGS